MSVAAFQPFVVRDRVRWSDSDPFGIIYYGAYIRRFQVAEEELFRACGMPFSELRENRGVWIPRKAFHAEFHSAAQLDEEVLVETYFSKIGRTSITMQFEVYRAENRVHRASGTLTVVAVDKPTMKPEPVPDWLRAALARYTS